MKSNNNYKNTAVGLHLHLLFISHSNFKFILYVELKNIKIVAPNILQDLTFILNHCQILKDNEGRSNWLPLLILYCAKEPNMFKKSDAWKTTSFYASDFQTQMNLVLSQFISILKNIE